MWRALFALANSAVACVVLMEAAPASERHLPAGGLQAQCESLAKADFSSIPDAPTQVTSAQAVEAKARIPSYCKVEGYVSPQVGFELRLPMAEWNGKFMKVGCGGYCGSINAYACDAPLSRGYACIASDMGHKGTAFDVLWARDNLQAQIDFGYRATHVAAITGKALAEHFYNKRPSRSYFVGCSTGGYQGLTAAQKFPWDFDGIIAGAPDVDGSAANLRVAWIIQSSLDESGKPRLRQQDLQLVHEAALARCDQDDGVEDGIIGSPFTCKFDPAELLCIGAERAQCLTAPQVETVKKLYAGPTTSGGARFPAGGFLPGSELMWGAFWPASSLEQFFRYGITGYSMSPGWKYSDIDFDRDPARLGLAAYYDNSNPDLRKFKQAGGKLIVYHGGNDTINLPGAVTDYYEMVERLMGGRQATQEFFRLFMIPGMNHCSGGKGAFAADWLTLLEAWVEHGKAPDVAMTAHVSDDYLANVPLSDLPLNLPPDTPREQRVDLAAYFLRLPLDQAVPVSFTRPSYPYPFHARYRGSGDPNDARSFIPMNPRAK